ncbi:MAG TPA: nucleotidyltransferase domain-containing protein [Smithellaceae bacterium]|jgi:predicted nucleotidyltransferase|nr:DNA polymerase subunit beta [Smithella sp.]HQP24687.1 nucleotidyltransferase domain-containing protein [Smithellaceae bacterium]
MAHPQINIPMDKIRDFCLRWKIVEFALIGSVLRDDFRPDSDIDVLLSFEANAGWSLYDIVDMKDELKAMFGREIDLVEKEAIRNPYRRRVMLTDKEVLYAA